MKLTLSQTILLLTIREEGFIREHHWDKDSVELSSDLTAVQNNNLIYFANSSPDKHGWHLTDEGISCNLMIVDQSAPNISSHIQLTSGKGIDSLSKLFIVTHKGELIQNAFLGDEKSAKELMGKVFGLSWQALSGLGFKLDSIPVYFPSEAHSQKTLSDIKVALDRLHLSGYLHGSGKDKDDVEQGPERKKNISQEVLSAFVLMQQEIESLKKENEQLKSK